jgi:hypothetical protein
MVDQQGSRPAVTRTTTPVITSSLYEAAFSTTGEHPQCGVALARTEDEARQRLADMLFLCDPTAPATADITALSRAQLVNSYTGTVGEVFAQVAAASVVERRCGPAGDIAAQIHRGGRGRTYAVKVADANVDR